ncbi:MAG TPA: SprT family zinc-dependent metalloprotease [Solirubrobacteraceae bacterium]|nr:SprT family zinc-dependent metalloprotease [Solirubrobacteraceae bacterium]
MPEPIAYRIRRSERVRRVRVAVDLERGVEVVLPMRTPERAAAAAVAELRPWIERRLEELAAVRGRLAERAGWVPYLDERLTLVEEAGRSRVHRRGQQLLVPAGVADQRAGLERWYRRAARDEVARRLDAATGQAGLRYTSLAIRGQRTRWASCAADGSMSFNWRLLLAPERVLEYVVWHEVCHLEVANHSPGFWALVERRCPGWREPAAWLRENGRDLVLVAQPLPGAGAPA